MFDKCKLNKDVFTHVIKPKYKFVSDDERNGRPNISLNQIVLHKVKHDPSVSISSSET